MARILHISDLHFGRPYLQEAGEALLRIAPSLEPDAIAVTGDISQRAKAREFEAARRFLDRLPTVPMLVVPGNHDVPPLRCITNGRVHRDQLRRCQRIFAEATPEAVRIVVAHHHFAPDPGYHALPVLRSAGRVRSAQPTHLSASGTAIRYVAARRAAG